MKNNMKSFKQFLKEHIILNGVEFILTHHFKNRLRERSDFSNNDFSVFLERVRNELPNIDIEGYFCFFSKSFNQGIVTYWDAIKEKMTLVTFLPKGEVFAKHNTQKVFIEEIDKEITYLILE